MLGHKNPPVNVGDVREVGSVPWVGKIPWRKAWQLTPVFLPGEFQGRRAWWTIVHGIANSQTRLKRLSRHAQAEEKK